MRSVRPEEGNENYYEMKELLKKKEASPTEQVKDREPSPRAIIRIPMEPERKRANPDADQGRITIKPSKPAEKKTREA